MLESAKIVAGIVINDDVFAEETSFKYIHKDTVKHSEEIFISQLLQRSLQHAVQNTAKPFSFKSRTRLG